MKSLVMSIVGARPQFIKAAMMARRLGEAHIPHKLVHTGQHYDFNMSEVFFRELELGAPHFALGVGSATHGEQTGRMLIECEKVLLEEKPSIVIVYGDTNTTLAGALAAVKLKIPVAHIEAGLRSFNRFMPEEINRVFADHVSELLFAPTDAAVENLEKESVGGKVVKVGDVMYDLAMEFIRKITPRENEILGTFGLHRKEYILATIHREVNTDREENLKNIFSALKGLASDGLKVFFPLHPRTRKCLERYGLLRKGIPENLTLHEPVSYHEMLVLERNANVIVTDSGGVQKEAYFFKVPSVIPRTETEWVEIINAGKATLTGPQEERIIEAVRVFNKGISSTIRTGVFTKGTVDLISGSDRTDGDTWPQFYGDGKASCHISTIIGGYLKGKKGVEKW